MKLLIVDDERLTREGLISSIDWNALGIDTILEADDGANGLKIGISEKPDIILCDIRMTRMTGIEMMEHILEKHPNVSAIFMSGYSDKEYLKAAIKLKAINYIEKPIQTEELIDSLEKAIEQVKNRYYSSRAQTIQADIFTKQLAYALTIPYNQSKDNLPTLLKQSNFETIIREYKYITTFIIKLDTNIEDPFVIPTLTEKIRNYIKEFHMNLIYTEKRVSHVVYHLFSKYAPSEQSLSMIGDFISACFFSFGKFYLSIGTTQKSISETYNSYSNAVILLESSFFFNEGITLTQAKYNHCETANLTEIEDTSNRFLDSFNDKNKEACFHLLEKMYLLLENHVGLMQNQVKGIYYTLFSEVFRAYSSLKLIPDEKNEVQENLMDIMDSCFSYENMHQALVKHLEKFYHLYSNNSEENSVIHLIREYIIKNYNDPNLSVKSISEYANLSTSYLCTFFKSETGTTLNQYITKLRIKKAKQLLADPRNKINEIGSQAGYNDGNYFGKSFRKYTGLSPSEYREQVLK